MHQLFDKFFSLYVIYNALYVEVAAYLSRKAISEGKDAYKLNNDRFPDEAAATKYVLDILGSERLLNMLRTDINTKTAINQLKEFINEENKERFWLCLDPVWDEPQQQKDRELYQGLNSASSDKRAGAILKVIYQVSCNMFHGRKEVHPVQSKLLIPIVSVLEKVVDKLYQDIEITRPIFRN